MTGTIMLTLVMWRWPHTTLIRQIPARCAVAMSAGLYETNSLPRRTLIALELPLGLLFNCPLIVIVHTDDQLFCVKVMMT